MLYHESSERCNYWKGLDVEVPEHLIRAPPAKQADFISIDIGTKEGHGAAGA